MKTKFLSRSRSGVSLLIGIGLVAVILFFALIVSNVVVSSIRQSANVTNANRAYYSAEGGLELALLDVANNYPGYSGENTLTANCVGGQTTNCTKIDYKIDGRVPVEQSYTGDFNELYGLPAPGTGTAGNDCDPLKAYVKKNFYYSPSDEPHFADSQLEQTYMGPEDPADHPCNWGKLKVGESVSIPLYTLLSPANEADCSEVIYDGVSKWCNPKGLGLDDLKVRLRTPCEEGEEYCDNADRYDLYVVGGNDGHIEDDKTLVAWSIEGMNVGGEKSYYLGAYDDLLPGVDERFEPFNSEIIGSDINLINDHIVLSLLNYGYDLDKNYGLVGSFLNDIDDFPRLNLNRIHKPTLKLSVISSLLEHISQGSDKIPYLEYQVLLSNSVIPPTGSGAIITAEARSGEYKQTLEVNWPYDTNLLEYVVQQ